MNKPFKDQVAVVTGGSCGIGQSTAVAFAQRGARVVIGDVADCAVTLARIKEVGGEAIAVECDVARMDHVERLMRMGNSGEVAEAVMWLCSDSASFVPGHCMAVDDAYLAR